MQYREMEKLGVQTSLLGFGCMRFPTISEDGKTRIDEAEAEKLMDKAFQAGVNYFDTAYPYHDGESELVVGRIMKKYNRKSFYLATKLPMWSVKQKEDVRRLFEEQLEKLQVDYIDYYLLHALDQMRWKLTMELGILDILEELRAEGKIRYIGFSFHDGYDVFEEIMRSREWDFCQIQLNYMDTEVQAGIKGYELAKEINIPVVVMEPIKGGSLVNYADDVKKILKDCRPDWSIASWAMRWVASLDHVKVVLSGMSTMEQVEDNIKTYHNFEKLTSRENEAVKTVVEELKKRVRNGCTECRYCMPCPVGIDIPYCFHIWNEFTMYHNKDTTRWHYFSNMKEENRADKCIECAACEKVCPQSIAIRDDLKTLDREFSAL